MKAGFIDPMRDEWLVLDVVKKDGRMRSVDNRRLFCLKALQQNDPSHDVKVRIRERFLNHDDLKADPVIVAAFADGNWRLSETKPGLSQKPLHWQPGNFECFEKYNDLPICSTTLRLPSFCGSHHILVFRFGACSGL